jgi:hypothetical protein
MSNVKGQKVNVWKENLLKSIVQRFLTFAICLLPFTFACEQPKKPSDAQQRLQRLDAYGPSKLDVVKLSELKAGVGGEETAKLKIFIKALDSCGSAVKAPCVFRVELYEHVARSSSPEGRRLEIWPDIDLSDPEKNNAQWRDYLRAYEFNFDVSAKLALGRVYIVEITCLSPMGKRLSSQYKLSYQK